jgi:hypothetical protein
MNGILLTGGLDALVIDARRQREYNQAMVRFYDSGNADTAIHFLLHCYKTQDAVLRYVEGP